MVHSGKDSKQKMASRPVNIFALGSVLGAFLQFCDAATVIPEQNA
jgi:hypothetical protein